MCKMMIYRNDQIYDFRQIRASRGDHEEYDDQGLSFVEVTMRVERRGVGVDCGRLFGGVLMENRDGKRGREQCAGDLA